MRSLLVGLVALATSVVGFADSSKYVRGFNLTDTDAIPYDADLTSGTKKPAQIIVDRLHEIGVRHIVLNPRGVMKDPRGTDIISLGDKPSEQTRYLKLIRYIASKGMTVGLRPIIFVVDPQTGGTYLRPEKAADGSVVQKYWWHGNIEPSGKVYQQRPDGRGPILGPDGKPVDASPYVWFQNFNNFLKSYVAIAKTANTMAPGSVTEFTLGAELYSMTVGLEIQDTDNNGVPDNPKEVPVNRMFQFGFPKQWNDIYSEVRGQLGPKVRLMYDINFTDAGNGSIANGGELERWRYRLVDLKDENNVNWRELSKFWKSLDAVGIDMYRSLIDRNDSIPTDQTELIAKLKVRADQYAIQLNDVMFSIAAATGELDLDTMTYSKKVVFKEVGYKSVEKEGFINPFTYDTSSGGLPLNVKHQAAAFEAFFQSFWQSNYAWFDGVAFWDASTDPSKHGANDKGFSPIGKAETSQVIKNYYGN